MRPTDSPGRVGSRGQGGYSTAPAGQFTPPANTVVPVIDNTSPTVGAVLSVTTGTWTGAPASFTYAYQWQRGTTNIGGATSSSYTVVSADVTFTLRCRVTAANGVAPNGVVFTADTSAAIFNYTTWNPNDKGAGITLSNGNLTAADTTTASDSVRSAIGKLSGKWYWEITINGLTDWLLGIATGAAPTTEYTGSDPNGWSYYNASGNKYTNSSPTAYGATYAIGDVIGVALNMDAGTVAFYKNGTSQGTAFTGLSGEMFASVGGNLSNVTANFGASAFAYSVPAGFNAGLYSLETTYATWNPSDTGSDVTLSNGNLTWTIAGATHPGTRSTIGKVSGKWYWEITWSSGTGPGGGFIDIPVKRGNTNRDYSSENSNEVGYMATGQKVISFSQSAYGAGFTIGDVIGVALNMDDGEATFYKNGVSQGVAITGLTGTHYAACNLFTTTPQATIANFGATALTYTPPSGFNAGLYS